MRVLYSILFMLALIIGGSARAADKGPYISLNAGAVIPNDTDATVLGITGTFGYDAGFTVDGALGYRFNKSFRAEAEIGYQQSSLSTLTFVGTTVTVDGDVDVLTGMANAYLDFPTNSDFTPYLMGGLGVAAIDIEGDKDTVPAGQLGVGLNFKVGEKVSLGLSYRFFIAQDPSFTDDATGIVIDAEYSAHRVLLGATLEF